MINKSLPNKSFAARLYKYLYMYILYIRLVSGSSIYYFEFSFICKYLKYFKMLRDFCNCGRLRILLSFIIALFCFSGLISRLLLLYSIILVFNLIHVFIHIIIIIMVLFYLFIQYYAVFFHSYLY